MKQITLIVLLLCCSFAIAQSSSAYQEGLHYKTIEPAYTPDDNKHVIVYEFFGYKCPHCANFQPYMKSLHEKLPPYVKVIRVPLGFSGAWKVLAQGYYTAQVMGILEKSHQAMFDAIHKQHKKLRSIEDVAQWFADNYGVDKNKFLETAKSFSVDSMIKKGNNIAVKVQALRTPKLVINGKFMPDAGTIGSYDGLIELTLELAEQEAQDMGLK